MIINIRAEHLEQKLQELQNNYKLGVNQEQNGTYTIIAIKKDKNVIK